MTTRPRLGFVVTSAVTATTFLRGYLRFLREEGWDVFLVCSDGPGLEELAEAEGVQVHRVSMKRDPAPLNDLRALIRMFVVLRRMSPDVIVYATPKASFIASIAGWFARVPRRVYELWGLRLETAVGIRRVIYRLLEGLTARLSSVVVANSFSLAARAEDLRVNGRREVITLGQGSSHGVDTAYFRRDARMSSLDAQTASALTKSTAPIIGFVGRLHPDKGLDTLLAALRLCSEQGILLQALIVGGEEGAQTTAEIERLRELMPVTLTGHVDDPRPYLLAMTTLVLVSRREGFPNVVLEAAALEVPAIVSDATGCIDAVDHGITGIIVPVGDAEALAGAIASALVDPRWCEKGYAARDRVLKYFSQKKVWKLHSQAFGGTHKGVE